MSGLAPALVAGVAAGYGIAMPLGAIGVLIVHEGLTRGWRWAAAAASGTALVDLGYVTIALVAGAAVTERLHGHTRAIHLVGAAMLVAIVVHGLLGLRRAAPLPVDAIPGAGPARTAALTAPAPVRTLRRFIALTAINPLTAIYFVVLTTALGEIVHGTASAAAFAAEVFVASWSWQLLLAAVGSLAGPRLPEAARTTISVAGYLVVLGFAVHLAVS